MRSLLSVFALLCLLAAPAIAHADSVVLGSSLVASSIDGVVVDGITYNVTFVAGAHDSLFDGNAAGAAAIGAELAADLNGTTAPFVGLQGVGAINQFIIPDSGFYSGPEFTSYSNAGDWHYIEQGYNDGSVAVFTPVPAPEPSSLILLGTGMLGVIGATRRRLLAQ